VLAYVPPAATLPPIEPSSTDQVTDVLDALATVGLNVVGCPAVTAAAFGLAATVTLAAGASPGACSPDRDAPGAHGQEDTTRCPVPTGRRPSAAACAA
jgi:hypothetical protein